LKMWALAPVPLGVPHTPISEVECSTLFLWGLPGLSGAQRTAQTSTSFLKGRAAGEIEHVAREDRNRQHDQRDNAAFRRGRAVVPENTSPEGDGPHAEGAALPGRTADRADDLHRARDLGRKKVPHRGTEPRLIVHIGCS